jgi:hypothetical protein
VVGSVYHFYERSEAPVERFFRERDLVPAMADRQAVEMAAISSLAFMATDPAH